MDMFIVSDSVKDISKEALKQISKELSGLLVGKELFKQYKSKEHSFGVITKVEATQFTEGFSCFLTLTLQDGKTISAHASNVSVGKVEWGYYIKNN